MMYSMRREALLTIIDLSSSEDGKYQEKEWHDLPEAYFVHYLDIMECPSVVDHLHESIRDHEAEQWEYSKQQASIQMS
jgi:hypothetical protein